MTKILRPDSLANTTQSVKNHENLAIIGGKPLFPECLHVGRPNIGNQRHLMSRLKDMLDRRWLTNSGLYVKEFEKQVADFLNVKHCIAMCNGTVALEIAVRALGMQGEVIIPSFTFVATAHCLQWQGISPVFADIDPQSFTIDPVAIKKLITPKTTGIIGVHLWGMPCHMEALEKISAEYGIKLLYDASHAFGNSCRGRMIGGFGSAEVFSFHATKIINTFEGGAIVTNDDDLASRLRLMKNFGFKGMDNVVYLGTNGKMNEASAAMGLTNLEDIERFIDANRRNYAEYRRSLEGIPGVNLLVYDENEKNNFQYVVIEIDPREARLNRDELLSVLHAENVMARRYFYPGCHRMEPYRSLFPNASLWLGETEKKARRVLCLPTGTAVRRKDVRAICGLIRLALENAATLRRHVALKN
jgi:dTDP-4-amino-4,6-dideoxygalactose transaminase